MQCGQYASALWKVGNEHEKGLHGHMFLYMYSISKKKIAMRIPREFLSLCFLSLSLTNRSLLEQ